MSWAQSSPSPRPKIQVLATEVLPTSIVGGSLDQMKQHFQKPLENWRWTAIQDGCLETLLSWLIKAKTLTF